MRITKTLRSLSKTEETPFLAIDIRSISKKFKTLSTALPGMEVYYALKANHDSEIVRILDREGSGFEIASEGELKVLKKMGVSSKKIICMHTIKTPSFIRVLRNEDINILAFDSFDEVDKVLRYFPGAKLVLRLEVENKGSDWPLTKKFGVTVREAKELISYCNERKLIVYGLTFHVGSQCRDKSSWESAIKLSSEFWFQNFGKRTQLGFLSLGGGLPIRQTLNVPSMREIGKVITRSLDKYFDRSKILRVSIEPGRGLIGDSGIMVSTVVGIAKRGSERWVYIDAGVFNALMETVQGYKYEFKVLGNKDVNAVTIAGPSCDSVDVVSESTDLGCVEIGDKVFIMNCAAYTTAYAAPFNGFAVPGVVYV
ncbi:hypothetical protein A2716_00345 [candidate division WWE3 bacterium RIFCSPHIGHO2_01_FULL_40_23]|uniref:ornithine decarboxylase n=1 Tax=candidate division WWE3 bacterium RIFCSPLOWO2_01_FULL_41_18 TaxID=1802625 RepID=A0A1F4VDT6_UNCKA|nr:MAG: hypothetical protein A2716_00345 [candidate division WWE3 bacterium RIFCSPHIGHO2_01_FULL_40_23]OGC55446.1 MAG: hypothetical protein A3A78_00615 [candidate division WWE3 bacterium RIFCSPLOWO2_01_FULL_41_18]